jgi:hypothetical protein
MMWWRHFEVRDLWDLIHPDNDINGVVLLDLDDELLEEMEIEVARRKQILQVGFDEYAHPP